MVYFTDYKGCLAILPKEGANIKNGVLLSIRKPISGRFKSPYISFDFPDSLTDWSVEPADVPNTRCLLSSLHAENTKEENFTTLGSRIVSNEAHWGIDLKIAGCFDYIKMYWEWTEDVLFHYNRLLTNAAIFNAVYASLYTYDYSKHIIRAFCEAWCPSTNTIHIACGEASISLWDLHKLGGLPIHGIFYDEVIPCTSELIGRDKDGYFLQESCKFLFAAFYALKKSTEDEVTVAAWIDFWFKGTSRYPAPPPRKSRTARSTETHNPTGILRQHYGRGEAGCDACDALKIKESSRDETYLAAYLSCWLCVFVLPNKDSSTIRPETFKMASIMASGEAVNLAIPVLASIYHGMNQIALSAKAGSSGACFPLHYVIGWLSHYFRTHHSNSIDGSGPLMVKYSGEGRSRYFKDVDARKLIYNNIIWNATSHPRNKDETLIDNGDLSKSAYEYLVSVRSSFLPARCNHAIIIEPYSPHRFGRQFGFCQDLPGTLKDDIRYGSEDKLCRLWSLCTRYATKSRLIAPARSPSINELVTPEYTRWWSITHDAYFENSIDALISNGQTSLLKRKRIPKDDIEPKNLEEVIKISSRSDLEGEHVSASEKVVQENKHAASKSSTENSGREQHWKRAKGKKVLHDDVSPAKSEASICDNNELSDLHKSIPPYEDATTVDQAPIVARAKSSTSSEPSHFSADDIIIDGQLKFATMLWEGIRPKIIEAPFDQVPSFVEEVRKVLSAIEANKYIDSSPLRRMVENYFESVQEFNNLQSSISSRMSLKDQAEQLDALKIQLRDAASLEDEAMSNIDSLRSKMWSIDEKITALKLKKSDLESSLEAAEEDLSSKKFITSNLHKEMNSIKSQPTFSDAEVEGLAQLKNTLKTSQRNLASFKWQS